MLFRRSLYDRLLDWKTRRASRAALLVEGARRVGKSTLVEDFAQREYRSYVLIDFWQATADVFQAFERLGSDLDAFFRYIQLAYDTRLYEGESLIILDEVQLCPRARGCIKQLVADGRYHYVETGSLISIRQNISGIPIPSEETSVRLDPLTFPEFLAARDYDLLADAIRESFERLEPLPDGIHQKAMRLFREYLLVGGMPQVLSLFLERNNYQDADEEKRDLLALYRNDIVRFAQGYAPRVHAAFDAIPGQLSKHEKKFTVSALGKNARVREYGEAFDWLADACIVNTCRAVSDPQVGLALYEDAAAFKCYMADTGLLVTHALSDRASTSGRIYQDVLDGKLDLNEGMLVENVVAQQLRASGHRLRFYSQTGGPSAERMEIDFLIAREYGNANGKTRVSPVEVKSGRRYATSSLDKFRAKFGRHVGTAFVLHPRQMSVEGDLVRLPLYMAHLL